MPTQSQTHLKVLLPINFSAKSELALDFALHYAQLHSCELYMFHVFEGAGTNFRQLDHLNEEYMGRMERLMNGAIRALHTKGVTVPIKEVHRRIAHGKAGKEIAKMAMGIDADIIVMGAPSGKMLKKVVSNVPCTLVLVKDKEA